MAFDVEVAIVTAKGFVGGGPGLSDSFCEPFITRIFSACLSAALSNSCCCSTSSCCRSTSSRPLSLILNLATILPADSKFP